MDLQKDLDRVKSKVFIGNNSAFLGPLMCSMEFHWDTSFPTAATDGLKIWWNPDWFRSLKPESRATVLVHELWHPARMHMHRRGDRDPKIWNYACDIRINNDLENERNDAGKPLYSFEGLEWCWKDHSFDANGRASEEAIYEELLKRGQQPKGHTWNSQAPDSPGDMLPATSAQVREQVAAVISAAHQARLSGKPGDIPGEIEEVIKEFLKPVVPWERKLMKFFTDLLEDHHTWSRPNRRHLHTGLYLPSRFTDDGRLAHLRYYLDTSGSIMTKDIVRFNSEVKYVWDTLKPERMTLVQFDTRITKVTEFNEGDTFEEIEVKGRGGTSLREVREDMIKEMPTAAIIFSDLECAPMEALPFDIPTLWVCIRNRNIAVPFGDLIHIR